MSRAITALLAKFFLYFVIGWVTLRTMDGNSVGWIITFAILGTIVNYLLGDRYILPQYGNLVACIVDGFAAGAIIYTLDIMYNEFDSQALTLIILALLVGIGEYFFHVYIFRNKNTEV